MNFTEDKKNEYWNYFLTQKDFWGHGVTLNRLKKVKTILWHDDNFWSDILFRHNGGMETPEQMKMRDKFAYNHCIGNMASMITQTMHT
jgi:hypothetical protein